MTDVSQFYVYKASIPLGASGSEAHSEWFGPMTRDLADKHRAALEDIRPNGTYADVRPASAETLRHVREWRKGGRALTALTAWGEMGTVYFDGNGNPRVDMATCGHCGRSWNDALGTSITPVPSARCPFEYDHVYEDES